MLDSSLNEIPNYKAYVMAGNDMSPTINEGDHVVVDLAQRFIRSGDIYVVEYKNVIYLANAFLMRLHGCVINTLARSVC